MQIPEKGEPSVQRSGPRELRTEDFLPARRTLPTLRNAAASWQGCTLYVRATQTVFGEGRPTARLMAVGEQPGDAEDRQGRPFVGPAGRILEKAFAAVGLDRESVYLTNVVKHFYFEDRGKMRIHKKPRARDVRACHPWLQAELELIRPQVLLLLGATAAQALLGPEFRVTRDRGKPMASDLAPLVMATAHPSAVLRAPDAGAREDAFRSLVADLQRAADARWRAIIMCQAGGTSWPSLRTSRRANSKATSPVSSIATSACGARPTARGGYGSWSRSRARR
jgi:DNA polymerase